MKLGFSTGNARKPIAPRVARSIEPVDRFIRFRWIQPGLGLVKEVTFFNQADPSQAVEMLRKMADEIEDRSK